MLSQSLVLSITKKKQICNNLIKSDSISFFIKKILKYFNDFQNQNFSLLWLKWTPIMQMKQNQTFFHGTYSNLTSYFFLSKNIKVFPWLSKSKLLSFMTTMNPNNENETKNQTFSHGTCWSLTSFFIGHKILNYFNGFLHKLVKWNETKLGMCKSDSIFP